MEKRQTGMWQYRWKDEVIAAGLLLAFGFLVNGGIQIRGLFMDDLYLWSCYGEQSFREFVFPVGGTRFRFLYYLAAYLELALVGNHVTWFVPINIVLNTMVAYTVYRFARRLSGNRLISFLCGILYLLSRMSYYQISQVYGLMETMALWTAVGILWCLYEYVNEPGRRPFFWAACGLYFAVCFIHERYMVLLPLLYAALAMRRSRKVRDWLLPAGVFCLLLLIRLITIGTLSPAGTGGTDVADTMNLRQAVLFAVHQVLYLFGINMGPEHLSGVPWRQTALWVKALAAAADLVILGILAAYVVKIVKNKWERASILKNSLLFFLFIGACIACSSVTIRVEVRWVYVSMTGAWLWLAYMCGVIARPPAKKQEQAVRRLPDYRCAIACTALVIVYTALMIPVETYYRGKYPNLYFWHSQQQYNSLAEETYEKYGPAIFGKKIYILKNTYGVSDFYADAFFKVFDKDRKAEGTEVFFVDSIHDFGQVANNMLVIREEPAFYSYQDITEAVRILKCESVYGYYKDGWMDESAKIRVMAGSTGTIGLRLMYPGTMDGEEQSKIYMDRELAQEVDIVENITYVELKTRPYNIVELDFENNFYLEDAQEQRGEKRFSMMVEITAD